MDIIDVNAVTVGFLALQRGLPSGAHQHSTGHMLLVDEFITLNMSEAFKEMNFIKIYDFKVFGWYRIVLGVLIVFLSFANVI